MLHSELAAKEFKKTEISGDVEELYLQLGDLEQDDLYRLLRIAANLRDCMLTRLENKDETHCNYSCSLQENLPIRYSSSTHHPMHLIADIADEKFNSIQYEALFLVRVFSYLASENCGEITFILHYYMLINAFLHRLLVQQKNQVGFDQFQKITINELREVTEKRYKARFDQLQGMYVNHLSSLEGRFAPKTTRKKLEGLLREISKGYSAKDAMPYELKLVPHFIKQPDKRNANEIITYRHLALREQNTRMLTVLLDLLQNGATEQAEFARQHLIGFDAAANELHAGPEIFSPIYRQLAFGGFKNFTYHAGEDYVHLLSGMRAIFEAIEFLELQPGNRIGHATAVGIEPGLWLKRCSKRIYIKKEEWLDNLVFVYYLCQSQADLAYLCYRIEQDIAKLYCEIYGEENHRPVSQLIQAWLFRKYDPAIALGWQQHSWLNGFVTLERQLTDKAASSTKKINAAYHSSRVIKQGQILIEIDTDVLFNASELRLLQDRLLEIINEKQLAIETLPSSNVRISYYKNYQEHHILRWLGFTNEQDPKPNVVVGSDDTGIFMTNLKNEYVHIYQIIERTQGSHLAAQSIIKLQNNAKAFGFNR